MTDLNAIREHVVSMLDHGLSPTLTYHTSDHALDVAKQCNAIATKEGITDVQTLQILEIAGLYHDTGFLYKYNGHEEESCKIAKEQLPAFGLNKETIDNICEIILATKMPQRPASHLQQIICDADLDYLGREDYFILNEKLHKEFIEYNKTFNDEEWENSRMEFLSSHTYWTQSERQRRDALKLEHLAFLKRIDEISQ